MSNETNEVKPTPVAKEKVITLLNNLGVEWMQQSGFMKVFGPKGRQLYIGASQTSKHFARVDISGFVFDQGTRVPHCGVFGNVKQQLEMRNLTEEEILRNLGAVVEHMKTLPEVVKEKKAPKAKAEKAPANAAGDAAATGNTPDSEEAKAARASRLELIKKVAAEKGAKVSEKTLGEAGELPAATEPEPSAQA